MPSEHTEDKTATVPANEAFDPEALRVTFGTGETHELSVVGSDRIDEDAYVDGRSGGRTQPLTLEGLGPESTEFGEDGTYVYHGSISQARGSDTVTIRLGLASDIYPEQSVTIETIEPVSLEAANE